MILHRADAARPSRFRACSCWQRTASRLFESWNRICSCWPGGKTSTMRSTVCAALFVCRVAKTRWPVSAAVTASAIVSRSRISPTRITSGSSRSDGAQRVLESLGVHAQLALVDDAAACAMCRYSIGSSIVMMCSLRSWLIWLIIAASVVDLPEPVGPVTRTRPRGFRVSSPASRGRLQLLDRRDARRDHAESGGDASPLSLKTLTRNRRDLGERVGEVQLQVLSNLWICSSVRMS